MLTLHHLRVGRSIFTVWLLEELGADYALEVYVRDQNGRAPPELKQIHPLGKSPVIEDDGFILAESGAITHYLLSKYDTANAFGPPQDDMKAYAEWMQWLMYSEASAFAPLLIKLLVLRGEGPKPALIDGFATAEVALQLGYLESRLAGRDYILGDRFQAPDFSLTYIASMAERLGELGPYPQLQAYLARNISRPAFGRAVARAVE